jgi:hypothetical protein
MRIDIASDKLLGRVIHNLQKARISRCPMGIPTIALFSDRAWMANCA